MAYLDDFVWRPNQFDDTGAVGVRRGKRLYSQYVYICWNAVFGDLPVQPRPGCHHDRIEFNLIEHFAIVFESLLRFEFLRGHKEAQQMTFDCQYGKPKGNYQSLMVIFFQVFP